MPTAEGFIELGFAKPAAACQYSVEMQRQNGARMTMQVTGQHLMKLARNTK
jgi:hypothetical protein